MPIYCYSNKDRSVTVERAFCVGEVPKTIRIRGLGVMYRDHAKEGKAIVGSSAVWPLKTSTAGCAHGQESEMNEWVQEQGLSGVRFKNAQAVIDSPAAETKYLEARGLKRYTKKDWEKLEPKKRRTAKEWRKFLDE